MNISITVTMLHAMLPVTTSQTKSEVQRQSHELDPKNPMATLPHTMFAPTLTMCSKQFLEGKIQGICERQKLAEQSLERPRL